MESTFWIFRTITTLMQGTKSTNFQGNGSSQVEKFSDKTLVEEIKPAVMERYTSEKRNFSKLMARFSH